MKLRLISWNVRGLNSPHKRELVRYWLRNWKCDDICLQETKLYEIDLQLVRSLWGNSYVDWEMLPAIGTAGGGVMAMGSQGSREVGFNCMPIFCILFVEESC